MPKPPKVTADEIARWEIEQQVKREAVVAARVARKSYREIAAMFDISPGTAHKWFKQEMQKEQLEKGRGIVGERLVPKALAVYDQELDKGNLEAARDVLFGSGILTKGTKVEVTPGKPDPLETFRRRYFQPETIDAEEVHQVPSGEVAERVPDPQAEGA